MSVEGGTMSGGISGASTEVSVPSFSSEGFSSLSPLSSASLGGGSIFEAASDGGLFSETMPFVPSVSTLSEMPISASIDIFSSEFKTIGAQTPKLENPGLIEFSPSQSVPEKSVKDLNLGEFAVVARQVISDRTTQPSEILNGAWETSESKQNISGFREFIPTIKSESERRVTNFNSEEFMDISPFVINLQDKVETEKSVAKDRNLSGKPDLPGIGKIPETDEVTRISSREQNELEELQSLRLQLSELIKHQETSVDKSAEPKDQSNSTAKALVIAELEELVNEEEDTDEERKRKKKKNMKTTKNALYNLFKLVVDESAQKARKASIKFRIESVFANARKTNQKVKAYDLVNGLLEGKEHKSQLLTAEGFEEYPDGSNHEIRDELGNINIDDNSKKSESTLHSKAEIIADSKPAVRVSQEATTESVSEKDVNRVNKFVNSQFAPIF